MKAEAVALHKKNKGEGSSSKRTITPSTAFSSALWADETENHIALIKPLKDNRWDEIKTAADAFRGVKSADAARKESNREILASIKRGNGLADFESDEGC